MGRTADFQKAELFATRSPWVLRFPRRRAHDESNRGFVVATSCYIRLPLNLLVKGQLVAKGLLCNCAALKAGAEKAAVLKNPPRRAL